MIRISLLFRCGTVFVACSAITAAALAASSFSNSLTGFTGSSTQPDTQAAVAAAGFSFFDTIAPIDFDSTGAIFDPLNFENDGRNYMRTIESDYANVSFVAEITFVAPNIDIQDGYFGVGSGDANLDFFRVPDFGAPFASVQYWGENEVATPTIELYAIDDNVTKDSVLVDPANGLDDGTHRVRLSFDWFRKAADFSFDFDYAGGPFVADITAPSLDVLPLYKSNGWPTEPARIYFGGDEDIVFKDFQVTVNTAPVVYGDLNNNGTITSADWMILRGNLYADAGGSHFDAYFRGDLTADLAVNQADFVAFKILYEDANGAGSFARMLAGVPEPASHALFLSAALALTVSWRRESLRAAVDC
jgi:hypothetical protein